MLRIVVAEPGPEAHEHEAGVFARALRDAGHEVVHAGRQQGPEQVVATALQEDADVVALAGAGLHQLREVVEALAARDASDIGVVGSGDLPDADREAAGRLGVLRIFTSAATTSEITGWVREYDGATRRPT